MSTSSWPASRRCKRSSPDARGLRPVPGADPGPLQASEEQRAPSRRHVQRAGHEPPLWRRGLLPSEGRPLRARLRGAVRRTRMRDQSGQRIDAHHDVEGPPAVRGGGARRRRPREETRHLPERGAVEVRAPSPPCDAPRGPGEEGRLDLRPPKSMSPGPPSPDGIRLADRIGRTPLLSLDRIASHVAPGVRISAKAEWLNPGGSVKDRAALGMLRAAEKAGLTKDRTLLDATSGNTGIAIAMLAAAEGYRTTLCVPSNLSSDRRRMMEAYGAELILTPTSDGTDGAQKAAKDLALNDPEKYWYLDQYNNEANWRAHFASTGPEIWRQTRRTITHFVACLGTTGTFVGAGRYLKGKNPNVRLVGVQPDGPFHGIEGVKHLESSHVPGIWDPKLLDEILSVATEDAQRAVRRLAREEGLLVGTSSGAAFDAGLRLSERIKRGC